MISKKRTIPLKINVCEAMLRRYILESFAHHDLQDELDGRWAGYWGEQSLDYYLSFLDEQKYFIFHDLNLPRDEYTFQIDSYLLSSSFSLIIEVKNISGTLFFDQNAHQLIRTSQSGKEESFPDPVTQVKLHKHQLEHFFEKHHLPKVPIEYVVVICHKSSILKTNPGNESMFRRVFKLPSLLNRIEELEKTYSKEILTSKDIRKISKTLIKHNTPPRKFYLERYLTSDSQFQTGIHCPSCSFIPMIRMKRQWYCPNCKTYSKDAHINSLRDYFLLVDDKISNQQFREFARLSSRDVASRLLVSTNLPTLGVTKDRIYYPTEEFFY